MSDCVLLYNVILKFSELVYDLFKINIHKHPTLTSIAFSLYRREHMKIENIPVTSSTLYDNIKSGYMGGAVDVYRPKIGPGYYYDVNSLYPTVMKNNPYPIGRGYYFQGSRPLNSLFGIVYCTITAPNNLYAPILLTRVNFMASHTIAPTGNWKGWYFTGELQNAEKYGYVIEIHEGYKWDHKGYIFTSYVDTLYKLRQTFEKSDPKNLILKLLLNSLYGRFGLSPHMENISFEEDQDMIDNNLLVNRVELADTELFSYSLLKNQDLKKEGRQNISISLPISFITTAYARMFMSSIKMEYSDSLYYSDTDNFVLSKPLPEYMVGVWVGLKSYIVWGK